MSILNVLYDHSEENKDQATAALCSAGTTMLTLIGSRTLGSIYLKGRIQRPSIRIAKSINLRTTATALLILGGIDATLATTTGTVSFLTLSNIKGLSFLSKGLYKCASAATPLLFSLSKIASSAKLFFLNRAT